MNTVYIITTGFEYEDDGGPCGVYDNYEAAAVRAQELANEEPMNTVKLYSWPVNTTINRAGEFENVEYFTADRTSEAPLESADAPTGRVLTFEDVLQGMKDLARSQGSYGRAVREIEALTPEQLQKFKDTIDKMQFKNMVDFVMWWEG